MIFGLLSWSVWQQLPVLSQETHGDGITNLLWMSNNLLMSSSYIILFLIGLKVFCRSGHLNPFTEKRSMTQGSDFLSPQAVSEESHIFRLSAQHPAHVSLSPAAHLYFCGNLSRHFYVFLYITINTEVFSCLFFIAAHGGQLKQI